MARLNGRVALVTGAGRRGGIGEAIARRLAQEGAHMVIADLTEPPGEGVHPGTGTWEEMQAIAAEVESMGTRCVPLRVDVTQPDQVEAMISEVVRTLGRLDILVNNAGTVVDPAPVAEMSLAAWEHTLAVNATGTFLCCKHALPLMIKTSESGRIINIASVAAARPRPYMAAYAASKAAVVALTQALAQEVAPYGITVNAVLPGDIDTPMKRWGFALEARVLGQAEEEVRQRLLARIPLGRLGRPEEVAHLVAFLASEEAAFITGQAYRLTGGRELT